MLNAIECSKALTTDVFLLGIHKLGGFSLFINLVREAVSFANKERLNIARIACIERRDKRTIIEEAVKLTDSFYYSTIPP